jgi:hypothetical protein
MTDRFFPIEIFKDHQISTLPNKIVFQQISTVRYYKIELFRLDLLRKLMSIHPIDPRGDQIHP